MQQAHLKLKEIIWEITGKCNNHCEYCGSKDVWNTNIDDSTTQNICDKICKYPPEQIDISGGDPLLVNYKTHKYIIDKLKEKNIICKILLNPKSLLNCDYDKILQLYDWIGISLNTKEEFDALINETLSEGVATNFVRNHLSRSTIITNFNLQNIWNIDMIYNFVKKYNLAWQVQFTVYPENENKNAIYHNSDAVKYIVNKLKEYNYEKLILSDNMNSGNCGAGLSSLGITYDGKVSPCLSMRSWTKDFDIGSLFGDQCSEDSFDYDNPLEYIWKTYFSEYRFGEFKCCKDVCNNQCIDKLLNESIAPSNLSSDEIDDLLIGKEIKYPLDNTQQVLYYGVTMPNVMAYAVSGYDFTVLTNNKE
jgi:MoaA/NifB/PqqE/SkfB family radical SAM enzyme